MHNCVNAFSVFSSLLLLFSSPPPPPSFSPPPLSFLPSPPLLCFHLPIQYDKELEQLEKEINPLLGDKPQPALSYLLKKAVEKMKEVPEVSQ